MLSAAHTFFSLRSRLVALRFDTMGRMRSQTPRPDVILLVGLLLSHGTLARAQSAPSAVAAPVEVGFGLTIDRLGADVNADPDCAILGLPCTHEPPSRWGGFGLDLAGSVSVSERVAVTAAATVSAYGFDSRRWIAAHTEETNVVSAGLLGLTLRSPFGHPVAPTGEQDRAFVQILAGLEHTSITATHPVVDVTVGIDSHGPLGIRHRPATVRIAIAYRASPSAWDEVSGLRFFFGVVIGPH
jgi:hypothetical protein